MNLVPQVWRACINASRKRGYVLIGQSTVCGLSDGTQMRIAESIYNQPGKRHTAHIYSAVACKLR
eukprot:scaffold70525_cov19-Tisochrysis_lutea.AAC.1